MAAEHERGAILGVFQGAGNLGRTLVPLGAGWLYASVGPPSPFFAAAVMVIPAFALIVRARSGLRAAGAQAG
jgi:predicted MFS family arabinose efflux permease